MQGGQHMKRLLGILVITLTCTAVFTLSAEVTESRAINASVGDMVTLPLEPAEGIWEHRVITPALISVTGRRQLAERVELVLSMLSIGTGRLEAVRIVSNRVVDRKYFFFQIEAKPSEEVPVNQTAADERGTGQRGGQQESSEQQDFAFAERMYQDGEYEAAVQAFTLFRARYPQSAELHQLTLYEGQALHALARHSEAIARLGPVTQSGDERLRSLAQLWIGASAAALGNTDAAVAAYLSAFNPQHPDIDIRARTGLAVVYGRTGRSNLADEQFRRIFSLYANTRDQNEGYLPALFHAASFYDRDVLDAELAVKYYQEFLTLANGALARNEMNADNRRRLRQEIAQAEARLAFLRRTFTDFR
jgi:hypothetical protein